MEIIKRYMYLIHPKYSNVSVGETMTCVRTDTYLLKVGKSYKVNQVYSCGRVPCNCYGCTTDGIIIVLNGEKGEVVNSCGHVFKNSYGIEYK
jgi:hypothetical protein